MCKRKCDDCRKVWCPTDQNFVCVGICRHRRENQGRTVLLQIEYPGYGYGCRSCKAWRAPK